MIRHVAPRHNRVPYVQIGRDAACEVALGDGIISRIHATLEVTQRLGVVVFTDHSRNGTYYVRKGSTEPDATVLRCSIIMLPGDMLMLGHTTLRVEDPIEYEPAPAASGAGTAAHATLASSAAAAGSVAASAEKNPSAFRMVIDAAFTGLSDADHEASRPGNASPLPDDNRTAAAAAASGGTPNAAPPGAATQLRGASVAPQAAEPATHPTNMNGRATQSLERRGVSVADGKEIEQDSPRLRRDGEASPSPSDADGKSVSDNGSSTMSRHSSAQAMSVWSHPFTQLALQRGKARREREAAAAAARGDAIGSRDGSFVRGLHEHLHVAALPGGPHINGGASSSSAQSSLRTPATSGAAALGQRGHSTGGERLAAAAEGKHDGGERGGPMVPSSTSLCSSSSGIPGAAAAGAGRDSPDGTANLHANGASSADMWAAWVDGSPLGGRRGSSGALGNGAMPGSWRSARGLQAHGSMSLLTDVVSEHGSSDDEDDDDTDEDDDDDDGEEPLNAEDDGQSSRPSGDGDEGRMDDVASVRSGGPRGPANSARDGSRTPVSLRPAVATTVPTAPASAATHLQRANSPAQLGGAGTPATHATHHRNAGGAPSPIAPSSAAATRKPSPVSAPRRSASPAASFNRNMIWGQGPGGSPGTVGSSGFSEAVAKRP